MKIRTRIAYLFAVIVATLILIFCIVIYYLSANYREQEFYERLREKSITITKLLYQSNPKITPQTLKLIDEQDAMLLFAEKTTVYDNNVLIYHNQASPDSIDRFVSQQVVLSRNNEIRRRNGEREFLYKYYPGTGKKLIVVVSAVDKYGLSKLAFLITILSVGWVASVVVIVVAGWVFAGNALNPIAQVVSQIEQINMATLDKGRVSTENDKDEIAQLAQTFNRMLDRLQKSFYIQKSFVANASHELRTPLTVMSGQIEVTLLHERTADEYRKILHSLREDVNSMTDLTNNLLEMAYVSSDLFTLSFEKRRMDELILQAKADLLRRRPGYEVVIDFAEAPDEEEYYELVVNERLLRNAFINLMENACKFSDDQAVKVRIFFRTEAIVLQFADKGVGISDEELPYIFEPFFRSVTASTVSGHGLGLPLTLKIIELHKGEIMVSSKVKAGTTFTVTLYRKLISQSTNNGL